MFCSSRYFITFCPQPLLYKKLKNVSCEYDRLNSWNSTLQVAWYIRHVRWACLFHISYLYTWHLFRTALLNFRRRKNAQKIAPLVQYRVLKYIVNGRGSNPSIFILVRLSVGRRLVNLLPVANSVVYRTENQLDTIRSTKRSTFDTISIRYRYSIFRYDTVRQRQWGRKSHLDGW